MEFTMLKTKFTPVFTLFIALLVTSSNLSAVEDLNDALRDSKWNGIIGTWVDADSNGAAIKTTYAWKIKNRVIEVTSKEGQKETVSLMGVNAKTGKVFQMGADSDGGSFLGEWKMESNGDAVLGIGFTAPDGSEGLLNIRQKMVSQDAMMITIELPQPITFKMIRSKAKATK